MDGRTTSPAPAPTVPARVAASDRPPVVPFTDVTEASGIRFVHENGAEGEKLLPETMGAGVAVFDYDGDGRQDLLFVNGARWPWTRRSGSPTTPALYRNRGDGTFEDATAPAGLDVVLYGMGVAVGDYDNDGWPDLYLTGVGGNRLFANNHGRFRDVTAHAGV